MPPCTEQVIFGDFGIIHDLPVGQSVPVEITPEAPGEYIFHCGMNMVRGRLIVSRPDDAREGLRAPTNTKASFNV